VRKRLLQHYGKYGATSEFRISLPLGSYIPEIAYEGKAKAAQSFTGTPADDFHAAVPGVVTSQPESSYGGRPAGNQAFIDSATAQPETVLSNGRAGSRWLLFMVVIVLLNAAVWGLAWRRSSRTEASGGNAQSLVLPWTALLNSTHPLHLITSDPDIMGIQILTRSRISVSDYASHNYIPEDSKVSAEVKEICLKLLAGDKASTIDAAIVADVAGMARIASKTVNVQGARWFQFSDLKTDDNFVFLGSPSTDPWFSVFNDQLDFRIVQSQVPGGEMIQNVRRAANEPEFYSPTARGGGTGQSFAVVAFVANRDQYGQVLLLAGANREGTQAAGKFVTDLPRLSAALQNCGISPSGPLKHFEILLRVNTMAGYPSQFDVVACHILPSA
jgi:hypothetical protein